MKAKLMMFFDIILKLKENNVTQILKSLSVTNASIITEKLEKYSADRDKKD